MISLVVPLWVRAEAGIKTLGGSIKFFELSGQIAE
jgi:hypothetical protein